VFLLPNPYGREQVSLDGKWSAIVDQYEVGAGKKLWLDREPADKTEFLEYSWKGGMTLDVPGDWNHQEPGLWWYEGTVWYSRHFQAVREEGKRRILYFAGVSLRCEVWLNGTKVASHEGSFTPFQADVTDVLKEGDNFLAVRVNNNRRADAIPAMSFDWWNYGGITREVMLLSVPERHISDYFVRLEPGASDRIRVDVKLSEPVAEEVRFEIPELKLKGKLQTGSDGSASAVFKARKLKLWAPLSPKLYDVRIATAEDAVSDRIGFRQIEVEGTGILVNGEKTFLKSISFHEEIPMEKRRAVSEDDAHVLVDAALELGCNTIRLAHYPQSEHIVRYAEEKGLLIWEEIPLWQGIDFSNEDTYRKAETYLWEMIARDRNRCAIGFWSISNETKPAPARDAFLSRLLKYGRSLDGSRLFASAFDVAYYIPEADEFQMKDGFAGELDVIGVNKYMGWYAKWPKPAAEIKWNVFTDKPLIISEFGCEALAGRKGRADEAGSWSEDYQAALYRDNLTMFRNIPNLAGVSPWVLFDFLSPYRQHPVNQSSFNRKGLLSDKGVKKQAWHIMHEYYCGAVASYRDASAPVDARVEDLLSQMTLHEKVMQLNQYTLGRNDNVNNIGEAVKNIPAEIGSLIYFDTDPKLRNAMQKRAVEQSRLGIPILFGYDDIHGFKTLYQISLGQACSWNPELVEKMCAHSAREARRSGVDWTFSPMIDVARDPRWGRVAEGYGEDPYVNGVFGAATVRGYQGAGLTSQDAVASCLKHFVGYGASEAGRDYVYTEISRPTLWNVYLYPYKMGVDAGAVSLMSSFNDISGVPGSANHYTMTGVLRDRWGFDGLVVSDWDAVKQLINQGYSADLKEASAAALTAGVDIDMMSHGYDRYLEELVGEGKVPESVVDEAVRRVLRVKFRLGLFENPYTPESAPEERFFLPEAMQTASELAAESMVLLKNDGILPLKGVKKLAVIGPLAKNGSDLRGNWRGHSEADEVEVFFDAIVREFPDAEVRYAEGCEVEGKKADNINDIVELAKWADAVVLCLGEKLNWSGENTSRTSIALPNGQQELLSMVSMAGKPVVVTLTNGRPLELCHIVPFAKAIVETWQPGCNGASALAGILSGRINPSGKLAITFPYVTGQIPIYYNRHKSGRRGTQGIYKDGMPTEPLYSFGHGLSYTTFEYGEPVVVGTASLDAPFTVEVSVSNTGSVDGKEAVLWYVSDPYCSVLTRPEKELKFFEKKMIRAGATEVFRFEVDPARDLGYLDGDGKYFVEPGEYHILVGDKDLKLNL
jgi:beta-glucosidase